MPPQTDVRYMGIFRICQHRRELTVGTLSTLCRVPRLGVEAFVLATRTAVTLHVIERSVRLNVETRKQDQALYTEYLKFVHQNIIKIFREQTIIALSILKTFLHNKLFV
jgi:hypothetical protein